MKPWIIIQARATSTRLPRKIFKEVCGRSLLEHQVRRLEVLNSIQGILIATTREPTDDETEILSRRLGLRFYRGDEVDVLGRYFEAALSVGAQAIVRITSDCPLIDASVVEAVIRVFQESSSHYASNTIRRTFPRGLDVEVFSFEALRWAYYHAQSSFEREHVTPAIKAEATRFPQKSYESTDDHSRNRWTVDTEEDFALVRCIYEHLYPQNPNFSTQDVLNILSENPEWRELNAHIEQKKI